MSRQRQRALELSERDLSRWRLVEDFQRRLHEAARRQPLDGSWTDPRRRLEQAQYLSLFLMGLLNPVVRTMRGLCAASRLQRVQREVCGRRVSLASFSEAQALLEPALLAEVFAQLSQEVRAAALPSAPGSRQWLIQDSSLFDALPRMYWALWRRQGRAQAQVRLHLSLDLAQDVPVDAQISPGRRCERAVWRTQCRRGEGYVGDAYYGQDYQLLRELDQKQVAFVVRLRDSAVLQIEAELPLTPADCDAQVVRSAWVRLGGSGRYRSIRLRVVWVQTPEEVLRLVSNVALAELTAAEIARLYKQRWQVELFFRWVKCLLECRHWLAESPPGVAVQVYLALIAALLLQLYSGQRPNRRMMELIQLYLMGVATLEELWTGLEYEREQVRRKKARG